MPADFPESPGPRAVDRGEAYRRSVDVLRDCLSEHGFFATPTDQFNYRRVWSRDGGIIGLAALLTGDGELIAGVRKTLETLAAHQGPHGEIPSNVDPQSGRVSYGGTAGRVDGNLWFVICCGEYCLATRDTEFAAQIAPVLAKVRFVLGAWEYNNRGLLYVPQTGDWADEYLHAGYVMFDQLLYYQAQKTLGALRKRYPAAALGEMPLECSRLGKLIRANYWFNRAGEETPEDVYHEVLYNKGRQAAEHSEGEYWLSSFSPTGYSYRFDAFANVLVSLFGLAADKQREAVDQYISRIAPPKLPLLPAFHPVIRPVDEDWQDLQMNFSYTFKNQPYEFHNGGLWPVITGFYVADLARRGKTAEARRHLDALNRANSMSMDGRPWSFPEYVHGKKGTPGGMRLQGWSAAASIIGRHAVDGECVFGAACDD